jgi:uncharacterized protein YprB with RNaseH-like and TPR domain
MIQSSFIFLDRISHNTEKRMWSNGIHDWNSFLDAKSVPGISGLRKGYYDRSINEARKQLCDYNSSYFTDKLPRSEAWRLYDHFRDDCLFLDIETTGYYGDITVIGMYGCKEVMTLVKDRSLDKHNLKGIMSRYKMLVTFNGLSFDIPVINRYFNGVVPDVPHLDLRFPLAKLGFTGGLKAIEERLNVKRSEATRGLSGLDAVRLWNEYKKTGDDSALNLLVEYNTEDIINLRPLADFVFSEMKKNMVQNFKNC